MCPKTGRPKSENPKNIRLEIRLDKETNAILNRCSERLKLTKTDVIKKGIILVDEKEK